MRPIANNRLLLASLIIPLLYWGLGSITEPPRMSNAAAFAQILAGFFVLRRYAAQTWKIVVLGERNDNPGEEGSHLAIYGCFLLALGSVWGGGYNLLWHYLGEPDGWIGTTSAGFGRAMMAVGFWLVLMSPDVVMREVKISRQIWTAAMVITIAGISFALGTWRAGEVSTPYGIAKADWPVCTQEAPVKVSQSGAYHPPSSRHYNFTKPVRCLPSIGAAEAAGYRFGG